MFGSSTNLPKDNGIAENTSSTTKPNSDDTTSSNTSPSSKGSPNSGSPEGMAGGEKRSGNGSPPRSTGGDVTQVDKKRRSSSVGSKASSFLASAKQSLHFSSSPTSASKSNDSNQTPLQKLGRQDPALVVPQGQHNNSAGESMPTDSSTFRVGVWEDRNKKCRRTMEDTHAFLYNFLHTPAPSFGNDPSRKPKTDASQSSEMMETDNGYFAIFDGHAGNFAADWCGKKLHIILEELIRKNPNSPIPELLDQTFTSVDQQLETLPVKNSGCTAVCAVLRWEDRIPNKESATGSTAIGAATAAALKAQEESSKGDDKSGDSGVDVSKESSSTASAATPVASTSIAAGEATHAKLKTAASRQRVLYTANVGDARIILCRAGKALRLSYDHKGSDEAEGKRIANAGGLILNNRVNGVLAVTRALGDSYLKDLVTGHPYTTETVIQPDADEFIILACDGLWDVCQDQEAVELVRNIDDPMTASKTLVDFALSRFSTDNLSCMVVRFNKAKMKENKPIGVEGDAHHSPSKISEADKIIVEAKRRAEVEGAVGVSATNDGKGLESDAERSGNMESVIEEEAVEVDEPEPNSVTASSTAAAKAAQTAPAVPE